MQRYAYWRDNLPLGVFFVFIFVVWVGVHLLVGIGDKDAFSTQLVAGAIGGVLFAAFATAMLAWRRRRVGGAAELAAMNRAIRTGRLPEDAEPAVWAPELERRERTYGRGRITNPVLFGVFALLGVVAIVLGLSVAIAGIFVVLCVGLAIWGYVTSTRYLVRVRSLRTQLGAPDPADGPFTRAGFPEPPR